MFRFHTLEDRNMTRLTLSRLIVVAVSLFVFGLESLAAQTIENVVVKPRPSEGPLDNPLKGWCPYTDAGEINQPYSMVFQYISWRELEPVEGDFRFAEWERSWDVGAGKGKHIIFRVYIDYPTKPSGLPDWLRKAGVKETAYDDYGGGKSPDYNDSRMVAAMERLIAALGQRYNKDPRVAFIQLGLLGFWGEWHTYPRSELYASKGTEQRVIDAYRKSFPDKSLMVRYARDYAGKQPWIGFHDDMFPEDTDNGKDWGFLAGLRREKRMENWKLAVVGGEMVPGQAEKWLGAGLSTTNTALDRAHFTWVGPYCPALVTTKNKEFRKQSEALVRKMGYNFQITEVSHPSRTNKALQVTLKGNNTGVAPFYYPWVVEWALLDRAGKVVSIQKSAWDIRKWQPGAFEETAELDFSAPSGEYKLAIGIRDPWTDRPAVRFANELTVTNGWTVVSQLRVDE